MYEPNVTAHEKNGFNLSDEHRVITLSKIKGKVYIVIHYNFTLVRKNSFSSFLIYSVFNSVSY